MNHIHCLKLTTFWKNRKFDTGEKHLRRNPTSRDLSFNHKHFHSQKGVSPVPIIIHSTASFVAIWKCVMHRELKTEHFMFRDRGF